MANILVKCKSEVALRSNELLTPFKECKSEGD